MNLKATTCVLVRTVSGVYALQSGCITAFFCDEWNDLSDEEKREC